MLFFCSHGSTCVNLLFYKDQSLTRCGPSSFEVCLIRKLNPAAPNINQTCLLLYLPVSLHSMHILRLFWAYTANSYFYKSDLSWEKFICSIKAESITHDAISKYHIHGQPTKHSITATHKKYDVHPGSLLPITAQLIVVTSNGLLYYYILSLVTDFLEELLLRFPSCQTQTFVLSWKKLPSSVLKMRK